MAKKTAATVSRTATSGKFIVRNDGGSSSVHSSGKKTSATVRTSIAKNRDALKRLADR